MRSCFAFASSDLASRSCLHCVRQRASWSVGTSQRRHACSDGPVCVSGGRHIKHVRRRVRSPLANARREALLKVLSLLRAARPELLCRCCLCRRFAATASSTSPRSRHSSLHHVLHSCSLQGLQPLQKAVMGIFHLVSGAGHLGVQSDCHTVGALTTICASSHQRDTKRNRLSLWML